MKVPDNVIPFVRRTGGDEKSPAPSNRQRRGYRREPSIPTSKPVTSHSTGNAVSSAAAVAAVATVTGLRYTLFLVLMWIRPAIKLVLNLMAVPMLFVLPIVYVGMDASAMRTSILLWGLGFGFGSFVLRWLYDSLLLKLSPEPIFLT